MDQLPIYVACNLDNLPRLSAIEGELIMVKQSYDLLLEEQKMAVSETMKKMESIDNRISTTIQPINKGIAVQADAARSGVYRLLILMIEL